MYLRVGTRHLPPTVEVCDQDDFFSFKAVVVTPAHSWVDPGVLTEFAGRGDDVAWRDNLDHMLAYAESKGWPDDRGRIRAHVEVESDA